MNKKKIVLSAVCLILLVINVLIITIGYMLRKTSINSASIKVQNITTEASKESIQTLDKKNKPEKQDTNRFEGFKLTSENKGIPILCYHDVNPAQSNELLLSPEKFKEQMKYLKDNGYLPLTLDELYGFLRQNKPVPEKSVVITFDDGYRSNYTYAYPILKEFGFKATIFVISDFIDNDLYMTKTQLKELSDYGLDIESHTDKHEDLSTLNKEMQITTMIKSKESLEYLLEKKINYIAYPFGRMNEDTKKAAEVAGYKLGFNLQQGLADRDDNIYNIDRIYISNDHSIDEFIKRVTTTKK
ncbi:deacetylase [Clostridium polyendosporum]|uniref:Deacetylase n=1 Tax=Clostridium polyendosporum TaxID=69208 RepID=A0A919RYC6_9CLOT|nr:polysaccharide deacetylase family protein [Clostridium polyendosporum]GIM28539.1 deacetylase [Clostridium polyendosporum]